MKRITGRRAAYRWALIVLTVLAMGFIFTNSMDSPAKSNAESMLLVESASRVIPPEAGVSDYQLNVIVRKAAHFLEYFLLGAVSGMLETELGLFRSRRSRLAGTGAELLFAGSVSAVDEFVVQYFSRRNSSGWDVLLDVSGALAGMLFGVWLGRRIEKLLGNSRGNP